MSSVVASGTNKAARGTSWPPHGVLLDDAITAHADPPRVNSMHIQVCNNSQEMLVLHGTGCEVDEIFEATVRVYNLPVYLLAQWLSRYVP